MRTWWTAVVLVVLGLAAGGQGPSVTLAWYRNPEPDVCLYRCFVSDRSPVVRAVAGLEPVCVWAGAETNCTVGGLESGRGYWFSVSAVDLAGLEGDRSREVAYVVPAEPTAPSGVRVWLESGPGPGGPWTNVVAFDWTNAVGGFWRARVEAR